MAQEFRDTHIQAPHATDAHSPLAAARAQSSHPRVVIVGAGFGGLNAAEKLAHRDLDVLLLDRNNYHGFWPLLYQVATAGLEPELIAAPVRGIIRKHRNADFLMTEVTGVDIAQRQVLTHVGPIAYDYLILAAGSANNYFGNDELSKDTFGLKDIDDAELLRNQVLRAFERAMSESDVAKRQAMMTFVIVGGGPTGVELSGAFTELINHVLEKDYPALDIKDAKVVLVEASEHILATFPEGLQRKAYRRLQTMGVDLRLKTAVTSAEHGTVVFKDGSSLKADTVVWAAGVRAALIADQLGAEQARGARVKVTPMLHLPDHPEVFVIGDMAYLEGYKPNVAFPMVAPVAIQMGQLAAENILLHEAHRPLKRFRYFDKGQMATIGRSSAVFDSFGIRMSGFLAWVGWLFVHLLYLIGFRNRLVVVLSWAYNYFTYDRGVRLITGNQDWDRQHERDLETGNPLDQGAVSTNATSASYSN